MVFYSSFYESLKNLPDKEFCECIKMILDYGLYGIQPETDGILKTVFILIKPQIDKNNQRWINSCKPKNDSEGGSEDGKVTSGAKGTPNTGRTSTKRQANINQTGANRNQTTSEPQANVNDNDNVNDNHNHNENENVTGTENVNQNVPSKTADKADGKASVHTYGEYNNVYLSDKEYEQLKKELGSQRLEKSLQHLSRYMVRKPEYKSASHFEDLRQWVQDAINKSPKSEADIRAEKYLSQFDFDLDDILFSK